MSEKFLANQDLTPMLSHLRYINRTQKDDNNFQFAKHVSDIALSIFSCYDAKLLKGTH